MASLDSEVSDMVRALRIYVGRVVRRAKETVLMPNKAATERLRSKILHADLQRSLDFILLGQKEACWLPTRTASSQQVHWPLCLDAFPGLCGLVS